MVSRYPLRVRSLGVRTVHCLAHGRWNAPRLATCALERYLYYSMHTKDAICSCVSGPGTIARRVSKSALSPALTCIRLLLIVGSSSTCVDVIWHGSFVHARTLPCRTPATSWRWARWRSGRRPLPFRFLARPTGCCLIRRSALLVPAGSNHRTPRFPSHPLSTLTA